MTLRVCRVRLQSLIDEASRLTGEALEPRRAGSKPQREKRRACRSEIRVSPDLTAPGNTAPTRVVGLRPGYRAAEAPASGSRDECDATSRHWPSFSTHTRVKRNAPRNGPCSPVPCCTVRPVTTAVSP